MTTEVDIPVEERIVQVLRHLGIDKAHFAARIAGDWVGLAANHSEVISSLALVVPRSIATDAVSALSSSLLVVTGDQGNQAQAVQRSLTGLPKAKAVILPGYANSSWADAFAERADEVVPGLIEFWSQMRTENAMSPPPESEGQVCGISYRIQGSGPPLVLLPLGLAASQWEPVLPQLGQRFCTITLGGAYLGMVEQLETRASGHYGQLRRVLVDELKLQTGETVLDVGCGSGVHDRWLARRTNGANPIIAVDINPYLLREAQALARKDGLESAIEFREGNAESLPFKENSFEVTMSITAIEEVDADRMLAELYRVTRPGGRVGVVSRSEDLPGVINLPLPPALKAKLEAPGYASGGVSEHGCADVSLYRRFNELGLLDIKMLPQLAASYQPNPLLFLQRNLTATLSQEEAEQWRTAAAQAEAEGTFFIARPFHCAVGTKPA